MRRLPELVDYLDALSSLGDESARHVAVEAAHSMLDSDGAALVGPNGQRTVVGMAPETFDSTSGDMRDGAAITRLGNGPGWTASAVVRGMSGTRPSRLVVARLADRAYSSDDLLLLRGMAYALDIALRPLRIADLLEGRQRVIEHVARVQRAMVARIPLQELFHTVTASTRDLFDVELASLHLAEHGLLRTVSVRSVAAAPFSRWRPPYLTRGIAYEAWRSGEVVRTDDYSSQPFANPWIVEQGGRAAMAAPVREFGEVRGSLTVISFQPDRVFGDLHEETLRTFADQVSVALSDARAFETAERAMTDPVTGLPNRMIFMGWLADAIGNGSHVHLLFMDLDGFKHVNDAMGHAAGDELLRQSSERIIDASRAGDRVVRFGGDEFAVLIVDADDALVERIATNIRSAIARPFHINGTDVHVTASIGTADSAGGGEMPSDLLRRADSAMYAAKKAGGDRIV